MQSIAKLSKAKQRDGREGRQWMEGGEGLIPSDGQVVGGGREDSRWQIGLTKRFKKLSGPNVMF